MAATTSKEIKECAVHFVGNKEKQLKSFSSKTFEKLITLRKRWANLRNNAGNVWWNLYQIISENHENQYTQILNEDEKESFANGYFYHMESYCKVVNVSKLERAERNSMNQIQQTSESDMESEVSEPASKYICVYQRCRGEEKQDDLVQGTVIGSCRCRKNILPKCKVSNAASCLLNQPSACCKEQNQASEGKDHSLGDIVKNKDGKPNCLTASTRESCCHFQNCALNVLASEDVAGEHFLFLAVLTAPETVCKSHKSQWNWSS